MKILFVETALSGHRKIYHKTLIEYIGSNNALLITSENEPDVDCKQVIDSSINLRPRSLKDYRNWIKYIKNIAEKHNVTVIHFLDGDLLYRFCGHRLGQLKNYKTIITFHHVGQDLIHTLSTRRIMKRVSYGIVHTKHLWRRFEKIENLRLIEYPYFPMIENIPSKEESREFYHIETDKKVLLALGGTRYEKGVDILLNALNAVESDNLVLLVAGKEEYFKQEDLKKIDTGKVEVIFYMKSLSDMEWCMALSASDIVVLPYRRLFAGASGPLTEAVWFKKPVIGKSDGSIGDMVKKNRLGWTFETESTDSLAQVIRKALCEKITIGEEYMTFRNNLSIETFQEKYSMLFGE